MGEELANKGPGMLQDVSECSRADISSIERWDVYTPRFLDIAWSQCGVRKTWHAAATNRGYYPANGQSRNAVRCKLHLGRRFRLLVCRSCPATRLMVVVTSWK